MKKILILITLTLLYCCVKKTPTIAWEKNTSFADILKYTGERYVILDFFRDE